MVNKEKFYDRMKEMDLTQTKVAAAMDISQSTLNQKLNGIRPFFLDEARQLQNILDIADADFADYFFCRTVA